MRAARAIRRFGLLPALKAVNHSLRRICAAGHKLQFEAEWTEGRPPEWFDHLVDQHWRWYATRNPISWERGVFGRLGLPPGGRVLDLCCGGGFFAYHFYSNQSGKGVAVDFDPNAITHAQRYFPAPNVEFRCADIRSAMPEGPFDTVVWNAAIEHFTETEITAILQNIKARLGTQGMLYGYTIVEKADGKSHVDHEYEFKSKDDLARILKPHFANVMVFETETKDNYEERRNLYFYAADGALPFDANWPQRLRV